MKSGVNDGTCVVDETYFLVSWEIILQESSCCIPIMRIAAGLGRNYI
jgi:hypothetical protein